MMNRINEPVIQSEIITDMEAGVTYATNIGYPVIVRPAYTLGELVAELLKMKQSLEKY